MKILPYMVWSFQLLRFIRCSLGLSRGFDLFGDLVGPWVQIAFGGFGWVGRSGIETKEWFVNEMLALSIVKWFWIGRSAFPMVLQ